MYSLSTGPVRFACGAVALEAEEPRAAVEVEQRSDRLGELGVDERRPDEDPMLAAIPEADPLAAHRRRAAS